MSARVVLVSVPTPDKGREIAGILVEERLAACVNVIPGIESVYFWDGKINKEAEALLVLKTTQAKLIALEKRVHELHPYDVPEFVVLASTHTAGKYWNWLTDYLGNT